MADTRTRSNSRGTVTAPAVTRGTKKRPKAIVTDRDKVRTTGRSGSAIRVSTATTRRGNSVRGTGR